MISIIKKELKSYLLSPIGYVFIGLFLLIFSVLFLGSIFFSQSIQFEYLFRYDGTTILTMLIPILTMKMFSEERKNGTEQLLLTSPRSITSIVFGKFIAAAIVLLITEILTFMYFFILKYFGEPSFLVALSTLFGFFLLGLAYISFGMFASSITENQVIAAVISIVVFVAMMLIPYIIDIPQMFSLLYSFDKFPAGLISIPEIVTLVSFATLFILLTIIVLQRRKSVK